MVDFYECTVKTKQAQDPPTHLHNFMLLLGSADGAYLHSWVKLAVWDQVLHSEEVSTLISWATEQPSERRRWNALFSFTPALELLLWHCHFLYDIVIFWSSSLVETNTSNHPPVVKLQQVNCTSTRIPYTSIQPFKNYIFWLKLFSQLTC